MEASGDQLLLGCLTLDVLVTFQNPGTMKRQEELTWERLVGWNGLALPVPWSLTLFHFPLGLPEKG